MPQSGKTGISNNRFYDPTVKSQNGKIKPKLCIIKEGINQFNTVKERQKAVRELMEMELSLLKDKGDNPITNQMVDPPKEVVYEIDPSTPFGIALDRVILKLNGVPGTIDDAKSVVTYVKIAVEHLRCSIEGCGPEDYVFARGFVPAPVAIHPNVISRGGTN